MGFRGPQHLGRPAWDPVARLVLRGEKSGFRFQA